MYQSPLDGSFGRAEGTGAADLAAWGELLRWGTAELLAAEAGADIVADAGTGHAAREAALLLATALGVTRAVLLAFPERAAPAAARARYGAWVARRRRGEPIAYLVGQREFWSLALEVTPQVLVPRPETELLVERALELRGPSAASALDVGTGSGALALALAGERPGWRLTATDVSAEALAVARGNARRLGLERVEFVQGDWFGPVGGRRFDLILSNPPYVAADDPALERAPLCFEPRLALTPGRDPLAALAHLIDAAPAQLEDGGWLLLEHGADQAPSVSERLVARGFRHVRSRRDLAGRERITEAQWQAS